MLYQQDNISVDVTFARFGAKSYAINKINSVEVRQRHAHGQGLFALFAIIAFSCFMAMVMNGLSAGGLGGLFVFGAFAYWAWRRHQTLEYLLFLMTSSSEAQAFQTRDRDEIAALRDAIESAMTRQHERAVHVHHQFAVHPETGEQFAMNGDHPINIRKRLIG